MQLSDILEEHSLKNISKKTNISEENIEYLLAKKFEKIERVKALGFISIIEREFDADLGALKSEAQAYYAEQIPPEESIVIRGMLVEGKRRKPKWLPLIVLLLLAYASWYFVTQYNKSHSNTLQPVEDQAGEMEGASPKDLDIIHTIKQKWNDIVSNDPKEAIMTEEGTPDEEETASQAVVEVVEPVEIDEEKPEETNVTQIAE
ncbi:MAG TPA: hypothetical protein ENO02_09065 [Epsilonproteobacteria bacterium]|nr:hypothetical protein [Campylobacterota bacterium]